MASETDNKQKKKKKNVSRKTHRSIIRGMDDKQHAYILDLMRKTRLLQREAIYLNGTFYAERGYYRPLCPYFSLVSCFWAGRFGSSEGTGDLCWVDQANDAW